MSPGMGHGAVAGFEAVTVINRRDFGIVVYMFLQSGDAVVSDNITITLDIEALKQA